MTEKKHSKRSGFSDFIFNFATSLMIFSCFEFCGTKVSGKSDMAYPGNKM